MKPPLRLIVTGMHRSGTSFVASLLAAWNVRIGDRLLPADRGNPCGYFEDVDFLELNRRILVACTPPEDGHRDWGWTESGTFDAGQLPAHRDAAAALIAARDRTASSRSAPPRLQHIQKRVVAALAYGQVTPRQQRREI